MFGGDDASTPCTYALSESFVFNGPRLTSPTALGKLPSSINTSGKAASLLDSSFYFINDDSRDLRARPRDARSVQSRHRDALTSNSRTFFRATVSPELFSPLSGRKHGELMICEPRAVQDLPAVRARRRRAMQRERDHSRSEIEMFGQRQCLATVSKESMSSQLLNMGLTPPRGSGQKQQLHKLYRHRKKLWGFVAKIVSIWQLHLRRHVWTMWITHRDNSRSSDEQFFFGQGNLKFVFTDNAGCPLRPNSPQRAKRGVRISHIST